MALPLFTSPPLYHLPRPLQLCFSADGNFLYTGARKDSAIRCWDVRYGSGAELQRDGENSWRCCTVLPLQASSGVMPELRPWLVGC